MNVNKIIFFPPPILVLPPATGSSNFACPLIRLMRGNKLEKLLKTAKDKNLRIGLLTNGAINEDNDEKRERILRSIAESVDWVAISIDGIEPIDGIIRKFHINQCQLLKQFYDKLISKNHS